MIEYIAYFIPTGDKLGRFTTDSAKSAKLMATVKHGLKYKDVFVRPAPVESAPIKLRWQGPSNAPAVLVPRMRPYEVIKAVDYDDFCLDSHGGYGACVRVTGHTGAHRDQLGFGWERPLASRMEPVQVAPVTPAPIVYRVNSERGEYTGITLISAPVTSAPEPVDLSVCGDCMIMHANGEAPTDPQADQPEPWALYATKPADIGMGGGCRYDCAEDECECDQLGFSWSNCDGCGSRLGGDRYRFSLYPE